jgi:two-component system sensor histidine kinase ChvG
MRLAPRLVLVSLVTLLLPWAGCQHLREVESALRAGQADALGAAATAIAGMVAARPERFLLDPDRFAPDRTGSQDLYAHPLSRPPVLDGFGDDWGLPDEAWREAGGPAGQAIRFLAGEAGGFIYLALEVVDDRVLFGEPSVADAVMLRLGDPLVARLELILATAAPGPLRLAAGADPTGGRVEANWQPTSRGYSLELRLPLALTMDRLGFLVFDRDDEGDLTTGGTLAGPGAEPGWLVWRRRGIDRDLAGAVSPGTRVRLLDPAGFVLADAGTVDRGVVAATNPLTRRLLRFALGDPTTAAVPPRARPGWVDIESLDDIGAEQTTVLRLRAASADRVTLLAARPLPVTPGRDGLLIAEQDADAVLSLTDRAALRLFGASVLAGALAAGLLLGFALWLSLRIRRLSAAAGAGLEGRGTPSTLPESDSRDELGDLSRSFSRLLGQLQEYNRYLEGLGGKLTHELRTPMTVVRTSLENLRAEPSGERAERYLDRAQQGIERLQQMVTALGAATRMEEAIAAAEVRAFDLAELVAELGAAYAETTTRPRIECRVPRGPCPISGAPELVAQACDKLIENARDFCPPDGRIRLGLECGAAHAVVSVANTGSRLPAAGTGDLFDSLVSHRSGGDERPHLGLGLYLVRLIADHHGGAVAARNLPDDGGVVFELSLPRTP